MTPRGTLHGLVTYFYDDGSKQKEGRVANGLQEGAWQSWYRNGRLESVENWESGVMTDSSFNYLPNGKLAIAGFWENGQMEGRWTFYDSLSGDVHGYLLYENGKPIKRIER